MTDSDYTLDAAESLIGDLCRTGRIVDAARFASAAKAVLSTQDDSAKRLAICRKAISAYYSSGQCRDGLWLVRAAQRYARDAGLPMELARAYGAEVAFFADLGNLGQAIEAARDGVLLARQNGDYVGEATCLQNVAYAGTRARVWQDALQLARKVIVLAAPHADNPQMRELGYIAHGTAAHSLLALHEPAEGLAVLAQRVAFDFEPSSANQVHQRVLIESYAAQLNLLIGNIKSATVHARAARAFASRTESPRSDVQASLAEGAVEVATPGMEDAGIERLISALERAKSFKVASDAVLMTLCTSLEKLGRGDEALTFLRELHADQALTAQTNVADLIATYKLTEEKASDSSASAGDLTANIERRIDAIETTQSEREGYFRRYAPLERSCLISSLRFDTSGHHPYRVGALARVLAETMGMTGSTLDSVEMGGRLHDLGMSSIPDHLVSKRTALTSGEYQVMTNHCNAGIDMLKASGLGGDVVIEDIIRYHHERWDGTGYPERLFGVHIPKVAQIVGIVDVYDALTHARRYRSEWAPKVARIELRAMANRWFSAEIVDTFISLLERLETEYGNSLDEHLSQLAGSSALLMSRLELLRLSATDSTGDLPVSSKIQ